MHPKACFALFALGLALAHAIPASRIEKKSVNDEPAFDKDLKAEGLGDDKERAKKSTFCMEIKDKGAQVGQLGPVQTLNLVPQTQGGQQMQAFSIPSAQPSVQTYNIPSAQQTVQPVQAYSIPSPQQPVQTMSVIHTQSQPPAPQAVVIPQPVQPIHTLQIIQPPQPCPQQPSVNIQYQQPPTKEVETVEINREPEPTPAPEPQTTPQPPAKIIKPQTITKTIVVPQIEQVDMNFVPVAPLYKEQMIVKPMFMVPEAQKMTTVVKVPHCPHSHSSSVVQCNCRPTSMSVEPMSIMAVQRSKMMGGHALVPRQADATEQKA